AAADIGSPGQDDFRFGSFIVAYKTKDIIAAAFPGAQGIAADRPVQVGPVAHQENFRSVAPGRGEAEADIELPASQGIARGGTQIACPAVNRISVQLQQVVLLFETDHKIPRITSPGRIGGEIPVLKTIFEINGLTVTVRYAG